MDILTYAWVSTAALYADFDLSAMPPDKRRKFLMEEVGEFVAASAETALDDSYTPQLLAKATDVLVTLVGVLQAHGIPQADFEQAARIKLAGNDIKRRRNGWAYIGGKIQKAGQ